jgi:hypothetical protein
MPYKLNIVKETDKAYLIKQKNIEVWIAKSVLDLRGYTLPYCDIKGWFHTKLFFEKGDNKELMFILYHSQISHKELPENIRKTYQKYWESLDQGSNYDGNWNTSSGEWLGISAQDLGIPNC